MNKERMNYLKTQIEKERMNYLKTQIEEARAILDAASDIRDGTMLRFEEARAAYEIANEQHVAARAVHADALARSFSLKEDYWAAEEAAAITGEIDK